MDHADLQSPSGITILQHYSVIPSHMVVVLATIIILKLKPSVWPTVVLDIVVLGKVSTVKPVLSSHSK